MPAPTKQPVTSNLMILAGRRGTLLAALTALLAGWAWLEARAANSAGSSHAALVRQVEQMSNDVSAIDALRQAPKIAAERERPNDELLSQIKDALTAASIPLEQWIAHDPAPPVRMPNTPYKELAVRLSLEELTLRQLALFTFHLVEHDSALKIPYLRLTADQQPAQNHWNVDLKLAYLIYAPT